VSLEADDHPYLVPVVTHVTVDEWGGSDIGPVCFWEDDGQDDQDADVVRDGPISSLSLAQARKNYLQFGAYEVKMTENVRPPREDELSYLISSERWAVRVVESASAWQTKAQGENGLGA
jgi:hypothetical protein